MLTIIVAAAENGAIGKDNKLLWHLPGDLKRFKEITEYHTLIMGRKTFESLPGVLKNRRHIILTNNKDYCVKHEDVLIIHSVEDIAPLIEDKAEYFVIGGEQIYNALLPYCNRVYLTRVTGEYDADAFFPELDNSWKLESSQDMSTHKYETYVKLADN